MAKIRIEKLDKEVKRLNEMNKKPRLYAQETTE